MTRSGIAALIALIAAAPEARAQCPDGSPPPCAAVSVRPAARPTVSIPSPADRARRFLILPFRNVTRQEEQAWLVEGSTTMLSDALAQWQGITVVADEKLYPALKRAGIVPGVVADATSVRRLAEETGGWTVVTGEVLATGDRLRITARAWDAPTSRELVRVSSEIARTGDVRQAFDSVSLRLLRSVGLDSGTADLAHATTRDLDAYRAYLRGLAHARRLEVSSALQAFEEAVRRDTAFALAWARLADALVSSEPASILQPLSRAGRASARAVTLSAKLPPRQRTLVLAQNAVFRAQLSEARRLLDGLLREDPNDVEALIQVVSLEQFDPLLVNVPGGQRPRGTPSASARTAKRIVQLDPSRHMMYAVLAQLYGNAGSPNASAVPGLTREPTSYADYMQQVQRGDGLRIFQPQLVGDSLALIPVESLSVIRKDSIRAMQRTARAIARAWAEQWITVAGDQAAPHQLMSSFLALDGEWAGALRELAVAESIGIQTPTWSAPARRLVIFAKSGDLAGATRLSDSLTRAGFFANHNSLVTNTDAAMWAFALNLSRGRAQDAQTMLEQQTAMRRAIAPGVINQEGQAFTTLMGNQDPDDEPHISRAMRGRQLDSVMAHLADFAGSPRLSPWLPRLLSMLADVADTTHKRSADLLKAADALAARGQTFLAFSTASNATVNDSTLERAAAEYPWYRAPAEAYNAVKRAAMARMRPGSARVTAQQVVFEWKVDDSTPFPINRPETPAGRVEYSWEVSVDLGTRYYRVTANSPGKAATASPTTGTLSDVLPPHANRSVFSGTSAGGVRKDTTRMMNVALRTEAAPGVLRMIVTDQGVVDALRRDRPAQARFRFLPCVVPVGTVRRRECFDERITIEYSP